MVVQAILWILYGLLLQPEPGTGRSKGRGLRPGLLFQQKYTAAPLCPALYRVRLDPGGPSLKEPPVWEHRCSQPHRIRARVGGRNWGQKSKNQEGFLQEGM